VLLRTKSDIKLISLFAAARQCFDESWIP
jgi:hypothetical protein